MATIKGFVTVKVWEEEEVQRVLFGKRVLDVSMAYQMARHAPKPEDDRL